MISVRPLVEHDIPAVVALFARVYPQHRWRSQATCEAYFKEMLFNNPWRDLRLPSWVAEDRGHVAGLQAVVPRPMMFQGRKLRAAVSTQFIVDPDKRHSLIALQLAQACMSGPQDLTLADGANDESRRICLAIGGTVPSLYNLHWIRPLRPVRCALSLLEDRAALPMPLQYAARPLAAASDALATRLRPNRFLHQASVLKDSPLDPGTVLALLPEVMGGATLQPAYDLPALSWLLDQAARKTRHGTLRACSVLDARQRPIGWYLYYLHTGGVSEVVQIAARAGAFDDVLVQLLKDAWRLGAVAVRGRLDPRHIQEFSHRHCWFRREGTWTLVHSRNPDIIAAFQQGSAFLSRLDGEWWLRFLGEEQRPHGTQLPQIEAFRIDAMAASCRRVFVRRN